MTGVHIDTENCTRMGDGGGRQSLGGEGGTGRGGDAGGRGGTKWNEPTRVVPMRVVALLKAVSGGTARARGSRRWRGNEAVAHG